MGSPSPNKSQNFPLPVNESHASGSSGSFNSLYFDIHSSKEFGRYLIAKEDIDEKTLILSETPILFGPSDDKDLESDTVYLFCLSCCKQLTNLSTKTTDVAREHRDSATGTPLDEVDGCSTCYEVANIYHCSKCGWPVCDKMCETAPVHSDNECKFFTFLHYNHSTYPPPYKWLMYKSVILLRLLLLIHKDSKELWDNFLKNLEHHTELRNAKPNCLKADTVVLENLKYFTEGLRTKVRKSKKLKKYNLPYLEDESMLRRLIGTVNVNAFCANNDSSKRIARCMFKKASLFAHSCAPNCSWSIEISLSDPDREPFLKSSNGKRHRKNGVVDRPSCCNPCRNKVTPQIQVYSAVPIKKGEPVTIPYSTRHIFEGTLKRQICMEAVGHFMCKCRRCLDATELNTFMSAIRCFKCDEGFLVTSDPSNEEAPWVCMKICDGTSVEEKNSRSDDCPFENCDYKCGVGKIAYFTANLQDQVDWIRSKEMSWEREQEDLQKLFDKYHGKEFHTNHYLFHEISTRIVELLEERLTVQTSELDEKDRVEDSMKEMLQQRFLFHVKYLIKIADMILPGFNSHQDQLRYYLEEAESLQHHET